MNVHFHESLVPIFMVPDRYFAGILLFSASSLPSPRGKNQSFRAQVGNELASSCLSVLCVGITCMVHHTRLFSWFVLYELQREMWGEMWGKLVLNWFPGSSVWLLKSCLQMVNYFFMKLSGKEREGCTPEVLAAGEKAPHGESCC